MQYFFTSLDYATVALIAAIITLVIAYLILKILVSVVKHDLLRRRVPTALVGILTTILSALFWYFVIMAILSTLPGFDEMVLAMGIIFAFFILAIGLATSGVLKELVSGAFLVTDQDFGAGFRVKAGGIEGVVESVDIRKSRIRDSSGNLHILPNSVVEPNEWTVYERQNEKH
ncbi:MAG: mechanosensitive ion channel [archaeon]|nr:mechanosensitive ion channel [archaeon]